MDWSSPPTQLLHQEVTARRSSIRGAAGVPSRQGDANFAASRARSVIFDSCEICLKSFCTSCQVERHSPSSNSSFNPEFSSSVAIFGEIRAGISLVEARGQTDSFGGPGRRLQTDRPVSDIGDVDVCNDGARFAFPGDLDEVVEGCGAPIANN